jgi:hypothetical protein
MATRLFTNEEASDPGYRNIRDSDDPRLKLAKWHCEYLWMMFERHADEEFKTELRRAFDGSDKGRRGSARRKNCSSVSEQYLHET